MKNWTQVGVCDEERYPTDENLPGPAHLPPRPAQTRLQEIQLITKNYLYFVSKYVIHRKPLNFSSPNNVGVKWITLYILYIVYAYI